MTSLTETANTAEPSPLRVSELFESVQGEGPSTGKPCLFIRLAHCNLTCSWCDTKYTWDFRNYDYAREVSLWPVAALAARALNARNRQLVITGGEPLLQQRGLVALCARLDPDLYIEVETNGTVPPLPALLARINQWNVSPKLANAGDRRSLRIRPSALGVFRETERAWLKLVVTSHDDLLEVKGLVEELSWPAGRVLLMPQATTSSELRDRLPEVSNWAAQRGYGVSTRLHIELWGGRRGI
ncbi:MAG TPA: radical SAM protein [Polyangiaceae bacterium]|nr:radical SAM protein [Polyangiaceae bacterium]